MAIWQGVGVLWGPRPADGDGPDRRRRRALVALGLLLALVAVAEALATHPISGGWSVSVPAGVPASALENPAGGPASALENPADGAASSQNLLGGGPASPPEDVAGGAVFPARGPLRLLVLPLLALATTLPLPLLAGQPMIAAAVGGAAAVLSAGAFHTLTVAGAAAQVIALYRAGRHGRPVPALALAAPFPALALLPVAGLPVGELVLGLACLAPVAALGGVALAARAAAGAHSAARRQAAGDLLEHTARGERARIARELHDVVAHHISLVAVQAETARLAVPGMPQAGAERLLAIGDTARQALTEMRRLLGVLREDDGAEASWRPQPGLRLHELNELLDGSREAWGAATRLILRGAPAELDPGVELAAYRIVQEALTNARRHAPGAAVDVELDYTGAGLRLSIRDNGPGPLDGQGGHGLAGMRERAAAVGGELVTGPAPGGGFLVLAVLPGRESAA
ncbi:sensor histidine kinase [Nonomuraea coxensis]|uniref:sensor histidine kinase n=1 Tax=Nonomuraea coxensis TaxID=404386 RepID=UPI001B7FD1F1|nr:sensor histidine kinase [Nonomuraea coxensis]